MPDKAYKVLENNDGTHNGFEGEVVRSDAISNRQVRRCSRAYHIAEVPMWVTGAHGKTKLVRGELMKVLRKVLIISASLSGDSHVVGFQVERCSMQDAGRRA